MQREETAQNTEAKDSRSQRHRYISVRDSRNRKVRGLWQRNGAYYVQFWARGERSPRRTRLEATTLEGARKEMARVHENRDQGELPNRGYKPFFAEYAREYIEFLKLAAKNQKQPGAFHKSPATVRKEAGNLEQWIKHLGHVRVDQVTRAKVASFIEKRLGEGNSPRTVNLDVIMLRNVLKRALDAGHIRSLPTQGIKPLKWTAPKRGLLTPTELGKLLEAAASAGRNGPQLRCYLELLAFTGAREQDALRLPWSAVDFVGERVAVRISKNGQTRLVDFNEDLRRLLSDMKKARVPDSQFLFPSPRRGGKDRHITNFRAAFNVARAEAALPNVGFHDLRHYFASMCVMNGIDYMTTSDWLGHKDGGILVGKVYGHLLDTHKKAAAKKLSFFKEEKS